MEWTERKDAVSEAFDRLIGDSVDVLGPHKKAHLDDPTSEVEDGTWVVSGYVLVVEWRMMGSLDDVDAPGSEYVRVFGDKGITESHRAGLLHTALYDMD